MLVPAAAWPSTWPVLREALLAEATALSPDSLPPPPPPLLASAHARCSAGPPSHLQVSPQKDLLPKEDEGHAQPREQMVTQLSVALRRAHCKERSSQMVWPASQPTPSAK